MFESIIYKKCNIGEVLDRLLPSPENIEFFTEMALNPAAPAKYEDDFTLEYYISHDATRVNDDCRFGKLNKYDEAQIAYIDHYISMLPIVLYCGVNRYIYRTMKQTARNHPDADLYEAGLIHGSLVKGKELRDNYNFRIFVPAGSKVIYLGNAGYPEDTIEPVYEAVIQTGACLRILSKDSEYINCMLLSTN